MGPISVRDIVKIEQWKTVGKFRYLPLSGWTVWKGSTRMASLMIFFGT